MQLCISNILFGRLKFEGLGALRARAHANTQRTASGQQRTALTNRIEFKRNRRDPFWVSLTQIWVGRRRSLFFIWLLNVCLANKPSQQRQPAAS